MMAQEKFEWFWNNGLLKRLRDISEFTEVGLHESIVDNLHNEIFGRYKEIENAFKRAYEIKTPDRHNI